MTTPLEYISEFAGDDPYRAWFRIGEKRYRMVVSRELLDDLMPSTSHGAALHTYADALLKLAEQKIDAGYAEPGDGHEYVLLKTRDMSRVKALADD